MGVVYEAFDVELKRQVAVKVIRPELLASADALARFRREARTAARLFHPGVVTVYDFGVADDGRAYLVMELLNGRTLREELRERGRLDPRTVLDILRGVCGAVALAHENGLVHRDLKPENIFLAQSGQRQAAKILDFGLAKPLEPGATVTVAPTLPGAVIGTPAYMSPEQLRGDEPAEGWDVWALAVVAFEMLTGAHLFPLSGHPRSALAGGRNRAPSLDVPALAGASRVFFERAFAPDCSRRPASYASSSTNSRRPFNRRFSLRSRRPVLDPTSRLEPLAGRSHPRGCWRAPPPAIRRATLRARGRGALPKRGTAFRPRQ
jgi:serine/threonine-protein kinase